MATKLIENVLVKSYTIEGALCEVGEEIVFYPNSSIVQISVPTKDATPQVTDIALQFVDNKCTLEIRV